MSLQYYALFLWERAGVRVAEGACGALCAERERKSFAAAIHFSAIERRSSSFTARLLVRTVPVSNSHPSLITRMKIVGIQGSPSASSRSGSLLALAQSRLQGVATSAHLITVRDLPAQALLHAQFEHPLIRQALDEVSEAQVVLIATPIYKAAYSGVLKSFLDLLPQDALRGKTVLPLATGGSIAHLLALDYALKPVLSALGARDILDPVFATDAQIPKHETLGYSPLPDVVQRVESALQILIDRAEEFERSEEAARERDELIARLQPRSISESSNASNASNASSAPSASSTSSTSSTGTPTWPAGDVRWSV
jgi:FMN reductase